MKVGIPRHGWGICTFAIEQNQKFLHPQGEKPQVLKYNAKQIKQKKKEEGKEEEYFTLYQGLDDFGCGYIPPMIGVDAGRRTIHWGWGQSGNTKVTRVWKAINMKTLTQKKNKGGQKGFTRNFKVWKEEDQRSRPITKRSRPKVNSKKGSVPLGGHTSGKPRPMGKKKHARRGGWRK